MGYGSFSTCWLDQSPFGLPNGKMRSTVNADRLWRACRHEVLRRCRSLEGFCIGVALGRALALSISLRLQFVEHFPRSLTKHNCPSPQVGLCDEALVDHFGHRFGAQPRINPNIPSTNQSHPVVKAFETTKQTLTNPEKVFTVCSNIPPYIYTHIYIYTNILCKSVTIPAPEKSNPFG